MARIGETDYRQGALERWREAYALLRRDMFGGSIYLAGRAVEGMFRAVLWKSDRGYATGKKSLGTGHDLKTLFIAIKPLALLEVCDRPGKPGSLTESVNNVSRLWCNDMRFWPTAKVARAWRELGELAGRRTLKSAAQDYYNTCSAIIKRGDTLWQD